MLQVTSTLKSLNSLSCIQCNDENIYRNIIMINNNKKIITRKIGYNEYNTIKMAQHQQFDKTKTTRLLIVTSTVNLWLQKK